MASCYIQSGTIYMPSFRFRRDSNRIDVDIKRDPEILAERRRYEAREHLNDNGNGEEKKEAW